MRCRTFYDNRFNILKVSPLPSLTHCSAPGPLIMSTTNSSVNCPESLKSLLRAGSTYVLLCGLCVIVLKSCSSFCGRQPAGTSGRSLLELAPA